MKAILDRIPCWWWKLALGGLLVACASPTPTARDGGAPIDGAVGDGGSGDAGGGPPPGVRWLAWVAGDGQRATTLGRLEDLALVDTRPLSSRGGAAGDAYVDVDPGAIAWDPSGRAFAYLARATPGGVRQLFRTDLDHDQPGAPAKLSANQSDARAHEFSWLPVGPRLAFIEASTASATLKLGDAVAGSAQSTAVIDDAATFAVSPDSRWIAGAGTVGALRGLIVRPIGPRGPLTPVLVHQAEIRDLAFAPSGASLVYVARPTDLDLPELYAVALAGGRVGPEVRVNRALPGGAQIIFPRWSPVGDHLAFLELGPSSDGDTLYLDPDGPGVGDGPRRVSGAGVAVRFLTADVGFSPDGAWLAFEGTRDDLPGSASTRLYLSPTASSAGDAVEVGGGGFGDFAQIAGLRFAPDARTLAVCASFNGAAEGSLWLIDLTARPLTAVAAPLPDGPAGAVACASLAFSPDARWLAFQVQHFDATNSALPTELWRLRLADRDVARVDDPARATLFGTYLPAFAPTGAVLGFVDERQLLVVDLDGSAQPSSLVDQAVVSWTWRPSPR